MKTHHQINRIQGSTLLLIFLVCLHVPKAFSQLSGTYTIGTSGDYANFTAAASDLQTQGVSGPVVFNVLSGAYNEQFTLDYIPNASETSTVTFQSQTGDSTDVVIVSGDATYADNYVVKLKRQSYVTFKQLTFISTNETYSSVVQIEGYADHLSFYNCVFEGDYDSNNRKSLIYSQGTQIEGLMLDNNRFFKGGHAINLNCSGKNNLSPQIISNSFDSIGYSSITLNTADKINITGNEINGGSYGMRLSTIIGQSIISKNRIINISGEGINISGLHSSMDFEAEISNNEIAANKSGGGGLIISNSYGFNVYHNSVFVNRDYYQTKALSLTNCGSLVSVYNNNLICANSGYALYVENSTELKGCDYNNYYSPGRALAFWDDETIVYGVECEDIRSLKTVSGTNAHSVFAWPGFESDTILRPRSAWLDNAGKLLMMDDNDDIDGIVRDNPPDIGCYEFTSSNDVKPPLSGTITIGSGGYATLQQVLDDARIKGISDSIKIVFPTGIYDIHCTVHPIPGASSEHPVIIESASGNAGDVTLQYDAEGYDDNWVMKLRGSSFLRFRDLTFKALDERYCLLFDMSGMLDSLVFNSCVFTGKPISQSGTELFIADQDNMNFHYQQYVNNVFNYGKSSIYFNLSVHTSFPGKVAIKNNTFNESVNEAIYLREIGEVIISNNVIDSAGKGINVRYINNDAELSNNKIITEYGNGIYLSNSSFSPDSPGRIYNNFVSSYGNTNEPGIFISLTDTISLHYNSVYANTQVPFDVHHNYCPLRVERGKAVTMLNNIFFDNGTQYSVYIENSDILSSDNNCFYTNGTNLAYWDQVCADLETLKTISGMNEHSLSADPLYVSPVDLHVQSALLDSAGVPVAGITEDIDGDLRNPQYPDIGADEFGAAPTNFPPVAVNDSAEVMQGSSVNIPVLDNDSDPDGDSIYVSFVGTPVHGTVSMVDDTLRYLTPQDNFTGTDSLIYYIRDVRGLEDSAWVFVKVVPLQNLPPVAVDDYANVMTGGRTEISVLENDSDPDNDSIFIINVMNPVKGVVTWSGETVIYQAPQNNFTGLDSMEYFISDAVGLTDSAWVFVTVKANAFEPADISLDMLSMGTGLWADYDTDGDMDILAGGVGEGNSYQVKIYLNEGGTFTTSSLVTDIAPMQFDAAAWGDFDNDGDPDLIVAGFENTGLIRTPRTRLFRNENGQLNFIISGINMNNSGSVDWGDFDNDGDVDLLTGGEGTGIYRNDGPGEAGMWVFTKVKTLPAAREGSAKWGDYDGDGDLDILLSTTVTTGNIKIWLYSNDGNGDFTEINTGIENVTGRCIWYDYNHDGYPDIIIEGRENGALATKIYRNDQDNGSRKFTDTGAGLKGLEAGSLSFCDYDLDGDADLLITGTDDAGKAWTILYDYADNGQFVESGVSLPGVKWGNGKWGDFNGDGKPDLLLMGFRYDPANPGDNGAYTAVFVNNATGNNAPPTFPGGLTEKINGSSVILSWSPSTDQQSYAKALTYNLRMGTHPGSYEVVSAMADGNTGKLYVQETGNIGYHLQWEVKNLQLGRRYYWSVEAVDPSYAVSGFAAERSFVLENEFFSENPLLVPDGLGFGDVEWGDYDNDGDLDLAMTGKTKDGTNISVVYKNNDGSFSDIGAGIQGMWQSALAWGDYDNDGDLDLVISGNISDEGLSGLTKIYRNDGNNTFTAVQTTLIDVADGDVAWVDYDNDGDLDLFITGRYTDNISVAKIFRNDDGIFSLDTDVSIPGVYKSSVSWSDFDNDMDQDLLMSGLDDNGNAQTKIYLNNGGIFSEKADAGLPGIYDGEIAWLDYDNDGYSDILISGNAGEEGPVSKIFRNDHSGNFPDVNTGLEGAQNSAVAWGDLDCDGAPDVVIGSPAGVVVYLKKAAFTETISLPGIVNGAIALGDYNNDRRLDLVLTGHDNAGVPYCKMYYNYYDGAPANLAPDIPQGLSAYNDATGIVFQWQKAGDRDTPDTGLTYNLRIGTTPGGSEVMAPMSDPSSGYRKIVETGNAGNNTIMKVSGLEEGRAYYWSVQTIDPGYLGSAFAPEQSISRMPSHTVSGDIFLYSQTPATEATVYAYSLSDNGSVTNIVSTDISGTNKYEIEGVPEGRTTIKVLPDPAAYPDYLPTYLGSTATLVNADMFGLGQDTTVADIYLVHKPQNNGQYQFNGFFIGCSCVGDGCPCTAYVILPNNRTSGEDTTKVSGIYIYLLDSDGEIASWAVTDSEGYFSMDSIPEGTYTLYIDFMGLPVTSGNSTIVFNEDHPKYEISAIADETGITVTFLDIITAVDNPMSDPGIRIFPNPVHDYLYLRFGDAAVEDVTIRIIQMDGKVRKTINAGRVEASGIFTVPASGLSPGMYILSVDGRNIHYKARIIKLLH